MSSKGPRTRLRFRIGQLPDQAAGLQGWEERVAVHFIDRGEMEPEDIEAIRSTLAEIADGYAYRLTGPGWEKQGL